MRGEEKLEGLAASLRAVSNRMGPIEQLRSDYARVMSSLVRAMKAAQNWHDIVQVAECMVDIEVCHFWPMLKEAEYLCSDRPQTDTTTLNAGEETGPEQAESAS